MREYGVNSFGTLLLLGFGLAAAGTAGADRQADIDNDEQTIVHSHTIRPGYNETTRGDLPDRNKIWHIEAQLNHDSGTLRNTGATGDLLGSFSTGGRSIFAKEYLPGESTTGYY